MTTPEIKFDEIGYWSELKLEIIQKYAGAYSTILSNQQNLYHVYIDGFAGAGRHKSKATGAFIQGSPTIALNINPPFREYHLVDLDSKKVELLKDLIEDRKNAFVYSGDCNEILLKEILPKVEYVDFRRGLCLLDPYGLHLNWAVIEKAGKMKTIDMFLNFPVMDINRNALWRDPDRVPDSGVKRMNAFWGDESWRGVAYSTTGNLFGFPEKEDNETIAAGFRERLKKVAGFKEVPEPLPMRNSTGAIVYYLFFASQKHVAKSIIESIFAKYRNKGKA